MTQWFRLWHEMPNDPKFRTIAKASAQRIGDVLSVFLHLLVNASSNATERGRTQSFKSEDIASALDLEVDQVELILEAMQGRVLTGDRISGWEKRQVLREDGSAERAKAWRADQKRIREQKKHSDSEERTQANARKRPDTDTDTDTDTEHTQREASSTKAGEICRAIRAKGVSGVNPSNPQLVALIDRGVPVAVFEEAAQICVDRRKGMPYLLGIVKGRLSEATAISEGVAMPERPWDETRSSIEAKGIELGLGKWNEADLSPDRETFQAYADRVRHAVEVRQ